MERNIVQCTEETFSQRLNVISTKSWINHTNLIINEALSILFLFERLGGATVFKNSGHLTFSITAKHTHMHISLLLELLQKNQWLCLGCTSWCNIHYKCCHTSIVFASMQQKWTKWNLTKTLIPSTVRRRTQAEVHHSAKILLRE